jgi:hypothetical protein
VEQNETSHSDTEAVLDYSPSPTLTPPPIPGTTKIIMFILILHFLKLRKFSICFVVPLPQELSLSYNVG